MIFVSILSLLFIYLFLEWLGIKDKWSNSALAWSLSPFILSSCLLCFCWTWVSLNYLFFCLIYCGCHLLILLCFLLFSWDGVLKINEPLSFSLKLEPLKLDIVISFPDHGFHLRLILGHRYCISLAFCCSCLNLYTLESCGM